MKVAIIGTVGVPANYGGFESLVENLLTYQQRDDIEYTVYCSAKHYDTKLDTYKGAKLVYLPLDANGKQALPYDMWSLASAMMKHDVILSLGSSCSPLLPIIRLFSKKRIILNLDGIDTDRAKMKSVTKRALDIVRKLAAKHATVCISDNKGIQDHAMRLYGRESELIEYGGDNAFKVSDPDKLKSVYGLDEHGYTFKVARIEAENNIEMILEAFSRLPEEKLVIVGNWNRSEFGRTSRQKYSQFGNIMMLDPIYNPEDINLLRSSCKLYVHGHSVGGTNPSLVEAMNLGLPVVAYDCVFNRATTEDMAEYFASANELAQRVKYLLADNEKLSSIAQKMYEIAKRRYTWKIIASKYEALY